VFGLVIAVCWAPLVYVGDSFFGVASGSLAWVWMTPCYAMGWVLAIYLFKAPLKPLLVTLACAAGLGLAVIDFQSSPPGHDRIEAVADDVELPNGWELVSQHAEGNLSCIHECPTWFRVYQVNVPPAHARRRLLASLEGQGWHYERHHPSGGGEYYRMGQWLVWVGAANPGDQHVRLTFSAAE
jgi:hypothetical protein